MPCVYELQEAWLPWFAEGERSRLPLSLLIAPPEARAGGGMLEGAPVSETLRKGEACPDSDMAEMIALGETITNGTSNFKRFGSVAGSHQFRSIIEQPSLA